MDQNEEFLDDDATEDEYFEQELIDFMAAMGTMCSKLDGTKNVGSINIGAEPTDIIEAISLRFQKLDLPMPDDQYDRVYKALKELSSRVMKYPKAFQGWPSINTLFKTAKAFQKRYPTANAGKAADAVTAELMASAKAFQDSISQSPNQCQPNPNKVEFFLTGFFFYISLIIFFVCCCCFVVMFYFFIFFFFYLFLSLPDF